MIGRALKFGGYQGHTSVHTRGAQAFCDALGDGRNVAFLQNITTSGRQASELLTLTEAGTLDGCYFASSYLAGRVPELGLFDQHFAAADRRLVYAVLDGPFGRRLAEKVEAETGFKVLGYWDNGLRHISVANRPIRSPQDCQGLRIRTLANEAHQRVFRALGFEPQVIDVRDLAAAIEAKQVDAQENPLTNTYQMGLHKTQRHIVLTGHLLGVTLVLFNRETFQSWSQPVQAAVSAALAEATAKQRLFAQEEEAKCEAAMRRDGVEFTTLSAAERARFVAATAEEVAAMRAGLDVEILEMFHEELARVAAEQSPDPTKIREE